MKFFKLIDLAGQLAVVLLGLLYLLLNRSDGNFINLYFYTGSWQLLSFFIHLIRKEAWLSLKQRSAYGKTVAWIIIAGIVCYLLLFAGAPFLLFYFMILLFISPVIAIWYFLIGLTEWQTIKRKELIHLK